jgi:hypothetical protein
MFVMCSMLVAMCDSYFLVDGGGISSTHADGKSHMISLFVEVPVCIYFLYIQWLFDYQAMCTVRSDGEYGHECYIRVWWEMVGLSYFSICLKRLRQK